MRLRPARPWAPASWARRWVSDPGGAERHLWQALRAARVLLLACAVTTWTLNVANPALRHEWGAAVMDSVAPALLLGWAEVGPTLLRLASQLPNEAPVAPSTGRLVNHRPAPRPPNGSRRLPPPPGLPRLRPFNPADDDSNGPPGLNAHDPGMPDAA
jgi:hypothetical protein